MMNEAVLRQTGMSVLIKNLGTVEAERFISLMNKESFDYTRWHRDLFADMSVEELSAKAMEYHSAIHK
jgi:hypothetical protein